MAGIYIIYSYSGETYDAAVDLERGLKAEGIPTHSLPGFNPKRDEDDVAAADCVIALWDANSHAIYDWCIKAHVRSKLLLVRIDASPLPTTLFGADVLEKGAATATEIAKHVEKIYWREAEAMPLQRGSASRLLFISHASADAALAEKLVEQIEAMGVCCWIAPRDVRHGRDYRQEIVEAIERCSEAVLLMSPSANESDHVLREITLAAERRKSVLPMMLGKVSMRSAMEYQLSGLHWLMFKDAISSARDLLKSLP